MTLTDDHKIQVLISALGERYAALRAIRERVQAIGIWTLGILAGAGGWLLQTDQLLTLSERWIGALGLFVALSVLRWRYLSDLQRGFISQQRIAADLEAALGLFEPGLYGKPGQSMYPPSWAEAGRVGGRGRFFGSTYLLIYVGAGFLFAVLLLA